jgi:hypothetical protein
MCTILNELEDGGEGGIRRARPARSASKTKSQARRLVLGLRRRKMAERVGFDSWLFRRCFRLLAFASIPIRKQLKLFGFSTSKPLPS